MNAEDFHQSVSDGRKFIQDILNAVKMGRLKEPFFPDDIKRAVPLWNKGTYKLFPWKHCLQNPERRTTALFFYSGKEVPHLRNPPYKDRQYRLLRENDVD